MGELTYSVKVGYIEGGVSGKNVIVFGRDNSLILGDREKCVILDSTRSSVIQGNRERM